MVTKQYCEEWGKVFVNTYRKKDGTVVKSHCIDKPIPRVRAIRYSDIVGMSKDHRVVILKNGEELPYRRYGHHDTESADFLLG